MIITEKTISNLVQTHFPYFLQEEGPLFIEFVKNYYEWAETDNQFLYEGRKLSEYKDIDNTVDEFLVYFKEKYLKNIQFRTAASTRRMVKHSLDLYRAKGTPRAVDLLFKVVFDTPAEVYLPSRDIFKLSSGDWYEQYYLEVTPSPMNITFVGKQITGLQSNAKAFVEKLVRKKVKGVYTEVFTISNLKEYPLEELPFITGEILKVASQTSVKKNPKVMGSLTKVEVLSGSEGFNVGDIVDIESPLGIGAKGRITNVASVTGKVDFVLIDGGFGYTESSNIYISDKILRLSNVQVNSEYSTAYFTPFDTVSTKQAKINYINATNSFSIGENLYTYYSNGAVKGYGIIQGGGDTYSNSAIYSYNDVVTYAGNTWLMINSTSTAVNILPTNNLYWSSTGSVDSNTTSGNLYVTVVSGNLVAGGASSVNAYYTTSNAISANIGPSGYIDQSRTATVIGSTSNITISYANSLPFNQFETVYQLSNVGVITANGRIESSSDTNLIGTLTVSVESGLFVPTKPIYGETSNRTADITSIGIDIGIINATGQFFSNSGSYLFSNSYDGTSYSNGLIQTVSTGTLASFEISNTFANPETIQINNDFVNTYLSTALSAADYYLKPSAITNSASIVGDALNFDTITIGTIKYLTSINSGYDYNLDPIVTIREPLIAQYNKKDIILDISSASGGFIIGEIVRQPNTGARGIVKAANSSSISLRLINFENSFSNTAANTQIEGLGSSSIANVDYVFVDTKSQVMGWNANVTANVVSQTGSVTDIQIIDSGFGYKHLELGTFSSLDGSRSGTASMLLGTRTEEADKRGRQGKAIGRYRDRGGFLSSDKKIQDADYYQEFSYEIRSSVTLDKYEAMLKQLLHVAGTKYFASVVKSSSLSVGTTITSNSALINFTTDRTSTTSDNTSITTDTTYI